MEINEVIVVEGKDDVSAVKSAVKAEVIITNGFALSDETIQRIKLAQQRQGVILFTDPDYAGEWIRKKISQVVPNCKHAFLSREEATLSNNIGIENASQESIRIALDMVRQERVSKEPEFSVSDLLAAELMGGGNAGYRRDTLGRLLGIGYTNGKQFLNRLNNYGITRQEFKAALAKIDQVGELGAGNND